MLLGPLQSCGPDSRALMLAALGRRVPRAFPGGFCGEMPFSREAPLAGCSGRGCGRGWWLMVEVPTARSLCTPGLGWVAPPELSCVSCGGSCQVLSTPTGLSLDVWVVGQQGKVGSALRAKGHGWVRTRAELSMALAGAVIMCVTAHLPADLGQVGALRTGLREVLGPGGLLGPPWGCRWPPHAWPSVSLLPETHVPGSFCQQRCPPMAEDSVPPTPPDLCPPLSFPVQPRPACTLPPAYPSLSPGPCVHPVLAPRGREGLSVFLPPHTAAWRRAGQTSSDQTSLGSSRLCMLGSPSSFWACPC
ncbi:uncharacterized protein LOC117801112 [Ailuropoda melanoleuca]|uniref:uncharacterized protein LOC117801112 n=1 Tax=Ailuropoda melanoleuca TaxID=9646 RepID=UPI0014950322|nr:uncharacterized protein LOC117801112 [Ailuropoda melanoleuca]